MVSRLTWPAAPSRGAGSPPARRSARSPRARGRGAPAPPVHLPLAVGLVGVLALAVQVAHDLGDRHRVAGVDLGLVFLGAAAPHARLTRLRPFRVTSALSMILRELSLRRPGSCRLATGTRSIMRSCSNEIDEQLELVPGDLLGLDVDRPGRRHGSDRRRNRPYRRRTPSPWPSGSSSAWPCPSLHLARTALAIRARRARSPGVLGRTGIVSSAIRIPLGAPNRRRTGTRTASSRIISTKLSGRQGCLSHPGNASPMRRLHGCRARCAQDRTTQLALAGLLG